MIRAVNPQTGEVVELVGGKWVKVPGSEGMAPTAPAAPRERLTSGSFNAAMVGAGDALTTMGRNARGLLASAMGDEETQGRLQAEGQEAADLRGRLREEAPIASAIGAALPSLATLPIGMGIGGAGVLAGTAGRIGTQLGLGAAEGALSSESGDMGAGAAQGGALAGVGAMAGNMVQRIRSGRQAWQAARSPGGIGGGGPAGNLTDGTREVLEGAQRAGLRITPGQLMDDAVMRQTETGLARNPMTSRFFQDIKQENARTVNTLAARAMGVEGAADVGPAVRNVAADQLERKFTMIGDAIGDVDMAPIIGKVQKLAAEESMGPAPSFQASKILGRMETASKSRMGAAAGQGPDLISGGDLMKWRSEVARDMRAAFQTGRPDKGDTLGQVLEVIDDSIKDSALKAARGMPADAGEELASAYSRARGEWSVLRAMDRGGATLDGNVLPGQAARIMGQSDKLRFNAPRKGVAKLQGTGNIGEEPLGDFYDALRFSSSQIGRDIVGDSGTATGSAMTAWLNSGGTLPTASRAAGWVGRRMAVNPAMQAYVNNPAGAQAAMSIYRGIGDAGWQPGLTGGGAAGRGLGGLLAEE